MLRPYNVPNILHKHLLSYIGKGIIVIIIPEKSIIIFLCECNEWSNRDIDS